MENPKQIVYAPEELFSLKPGTPSLNTKNATMLSYNGGKVSSDQSTMPSLPEPGFWRTYGWYIAGSVIIMGGICFFIYYRNQRKKNSGNEN